MNTIAGCEKRRQVIITGLRRRGLTAPFLVDQPMNRRIFDIWVQTQLAPTLSKGDVVIRQITVRLRSLVRG